MPENSVTVKYERLINGMDIEQTKWRPSISSLLWFLLIVFSGLLYFLDVFQIEKYSVLMATPSAIPNIQMDQKLLKGFSINTPGCRIPELDPFDVSVKKFIKKPSLPSCNAGKPALVGSNTTSIFLIHDSLQSYELNSSSEVQCCYQEFWRVAPEPESSDKRVKYSKACINFTESCTITSEEFIKVICKNSSDLPIYYDYFGFVPIKPNLSAANEIIPTVKSKMNVLVIGLDAVSRVNLHRQMPKTVKYITKIGGVELKGYNKVADNTFPNLVPVLTGMNEAEFRNSCWAHQKDNFDPCYFVWQDYKKNGYVTAFGEDSAWMGMFNYQRNGFINQPTDYYYDTFDREAETKIGNSHNMNVYECEGPREVYKDFLDYVWKFVTRMDFQKLPYFGFFWGSTLTHDYFNKPSNGDQFYYEFLKKMKEAGHLDNTALILMSDHGIRWGEVRQTYQGRLEERLPFVIPILPKWFQDKYPLAFKNLLRNVRRLTTPFDLHETLVDFLNPADLQNDEIRKRSGRSTRRYSLFTDISNKRTCNDAAIDSHWCTCQESQEISVNHTLVQESAQYAVQDMNTQLSGYAQCAELRLEEVLNAQLMSHGDHIVHGDKKSKDLMITLRTVPGDGVFEVTVRRKDISDSNEQVTFEVIGTIGRLNLYGKQSSCITDFHLKLYCYCTSLL